MVVVEVEVDSVELDDDDMAAGGESNMAVAVVRDEVDEVEKDE